MNEKIKELAGQSGFDVTHDKWIFCDDPAGEGECHELLERFAQLIVKECCQALHPMLRDQISRGQGVDLIKKHFGVAE
jgi:hypothetical protein